MGVDEPDREVAYLGTVSHWIPGPAGGWGFIEPAAEIPGFVRVDISVSAEEGDRPERVDALHTLSAFVALGGDQ